MKIQIELGVPGVGIYGADLNLPPSRGWTRLWTQLKCPGKPDIMGVHLYYRHVNRTLVECKLRVSNGSVNRDGTGFCGKVYFDSLKVIAPSNLNIVAQNRFRESIEANVWTIATGQHVFLPRWILEREFCIAAPHETNNAEIILKRESLIIPEVVRDYGPLRVTMPTVDRLEYKSLCDEVIAGLSQAMQDGNEYYYADIAYLYKGAIGPWQPNGEQNAYAHGGFGIDPYSGFEQVKEAVYMHSLLHMLTMDRMPIACYDIETGDPIQPSDWHKQEDAHKGVIYEEQSQVLELLPFLKGSFGNYSYITFNPGNYCPYETRLNSYKAHDTAHSRRASIHAEPLWFYELNPMAADDLLLLVEHNRHEDLSDRSDEPINNPYIKSLSYWLHRARQNPHSGLPLDRAFGWAMYHAVLASKIRRGYAASWLRKAGIIFLLAADHNGIIERKHAHPYTPEGIESTQSFHTAIITLGACALSHYYPRNIRIKRTLARVVNNFYGSTTMSPRPYLYDDNLYGPPHWVWTYNDGQPIVPLTNNTASAHGDMIHVLAALGEVYRATGIRYAIEVSLRYWMPAGSISERAEQLSGIRAWGRTQFAGYQKIVEE